MEPVGGFLVPNEERQGNSFVLLITLEAWNIYFDINLLNLVNNLKGTDI